ncbi:MAG: hypothetical protein HQK89_02755 [Nitrospirae bacterium]|nr:hypothetical protein [Nitrospirota bacterium]
MLKTKVVNPVINKIVEIVDHAFSGALTAFSLLTVLGVLLTPCMAGAEWAEWIIDANVTGMHRDNINWAYGPGEKYRDYILNPHFSVGRYYQLAENTRAALTVNAQGEFYKVYPRLNCVTTGTSLSITQKLGYGARVPWLGLEGTIDYLDSSDDNRKSWLSTIAFSAGERFSERVDAVLRYAYSYRNGKDLPSAQPGASGKVFNMESHKVSVNVNTLITQKLLLSTGYAFRYGDINSTMDEDYIPFKKSHTEAVIIDNVYNDTDATFKLRANVNEIFVNAGYALGDHSSINLGYTWVNGHSYNWIYHENVLQASFMYSF